MGSLDFDLAVSRASVAPTQGNFQVMLDGNVYAAARSVSFPKHTSPRQAIVSSDGTTCLAFSDGVLDASATGNFKLLPASAKLFLATLQAKNPLSNAKNISFMLQAISIDPTTRATSHAHASLRCLLIDWNDDDVSAGGTELFGTTFQFVSVREISNGFSIQGAP